MKKENKYLTPDWVPDNAGEEFAVKVVKHTTSAKHKAASVSPSKAKLTIEDYYNGVLKNDRTVLAKTITLIESNSESHHKTAREVLNRLLVHTGNSVRIGISGVPGAGKSTLIEALGLYLIKAGHKVAVLTVDPSSSVTKGSILGDKTRMEKLSRENNCFIRPSPSGGVLGGVARKSRETMLTCEAAGYDIILIETVGVGQNEISVRSMVDFFILVQIPGAGDELQGIKKGVMEIADLILINKADGDNLHKANIANADISGILNLLTPFTKGWQTKVLLCSALTGIGLKEIWQTIVDFQNNTKSSGVFTENRKKQSIDWTYSLIQEFLINDFMSNKTVQKELSKLKEKVLSNEILPVAVADKLLNLYHSVITNKE